MVSTLPTCRECGAEYAMPAHYNSNFGLCEACRPIKVCRACEGRGQVFLPPKRGHGGGSWRACESCGGTRHEPAVMIRCLACEKPHWFSQRSHEANGVFNVFCNGECEDRYAARL